MLVDGGGLSGCRIFGVSDLPGEPEKRYELDSSGFTKRSKTLSEI